MRLKPAASLLVLFALRTLNMTSVAEETPDTGWEDRPTVTVAVELLPRTGVVTWGELQHGLNFSFQRWRGGVILNRRMKPILKPHRPDIDENNEHYFVFGAGYEYLHTVQNSSTRIENRIIAEATPRVLFAGVLLSDRNRTEFRWVNGAYDFRYRNKVVISDRLQAGKFRFTPYGSGELYYDRNYHSWNQNQYGFGMQFPYKRCLMLDTYLLHQNCTSRSQNSVNMIGATLNLYFREPQ
jgi:Protein of unknown function (DUF2490)